MGSTPRNLPRFLPILTEVVEPPQLTPIPVAAMPETAEAVPETAGIEPAPVQPIQDAPLCGLSEETKALVSQLVEEKLQLLRTQMLQELESVVRQAVAEALAPH